MILGSGLSVQWKAWEDAYDSFMFFPWNFMKRKPLPVRLIVFPLGFLWTIPCMVIGLFLVILPAMLVDVITDDL